MTRTVRIAAAQMDARTAPTAERLARALGLVTAAAADGADLVVLPEVFNTGYTYDDSNVGRAEDINGETSSWMRSTAERTGVHLAGSFLLREDGDVYNSLLLYAPNGVRWRYDKVHPWAWERSAFRGSRRHTVIASTELGRIGLLICWDTSDLDLWRRYAGRIDLMVITSCPIDVTNPTYHLSGGDTLRFSDIAPLGGLAGAEDALFGEMINEQLAWLSVPGVNSVGTGHVRTPIPRSQAILYGLVPFAPRLWSKVSGFGGLEMTAACTPGCKVVGADGRARGELSFDDGEEVTVADVELPAKSRLPSASQPATRLPKAAYVLSDVVIPRLMQPVYAKALREAWGGGAPMPARAPVARAVGKTMSAIRG